MYIEARDFKHYECYVSTTASFNPTGYSGSAWTGEPNALAGWNGTTNNLFMISPTKPINVVGLSPGTTYYVRVVAVDKSGQRSTPSAEVSCMAGDAQRSSTLVVAASDASTKSKAGADYVCGSTSCQSVVNDALLALPTGGGKVILTEGTFNINDSITIPGSNISLIGQGKNTIIKPFPNPESQSYNAIVLNGPSSITLENFAFDGTGMNGVSGDHRGMFLTNITNSSISKIHMENLDDAGIVFSNSGTNANSITDCVFDNISICVSDNGATNKINGCHFKNSELGVSVSGYGGAIINACAFEGNEVGALCDGDNNSISSCVFSYNSTYGLNLSCTNNIIASNNFIGNGTLANNTYAQLYMENAYAQSNCILNNVFRSGGATNKPKYGIQIIPGEAGSPDRNLVSGNDCYQSGVTSGIYNNGTNTSFGNGNRLNNGTWATGNG